MKIALITPRFAFAGVPLAQIRFARALAARGHSVDLIIGYVPPEYNVDLPPGVGKIVLNKDKVRNMLWPLVKYFWATKPDVVFSAEDHLTVIVLVAGIVSRSKSKISGSSRVLPTDRQAYSSKFLTKGWALKKIMRLVMSRADALTCVSEDMVGLYKEIFPAAPHVCVYNIIKDKESLLRASELVDHPWLVRKEYPVVISAGTMTKRKGFADLVMALSYVNKKFPCRLIILGDGYLREELISLVEGLGLRGMIDMPGNVANPLKYFSKSDVFVLSSYAEGLPNVLVEAMICGCTPVSTDCPTGPREVLQNGKYGYLVPMRDPQSMASAIEQALERPIPKALLDEAVIPFEEERVIDRHFEILRVLG